MVQYKRVCQRNDIEANWKLYNPVLLQGEIAYSLDVENFKIGDGVQTWEELPYYMVSLTEDEILALCE